MKSVDQSRMMDRYGTPSRPDDIPEAVWNSCWWAQAHGLQEAASRQIMAAKAEELSACVSIVQEVGTEWGALEAKQACEEAVFLMLGRAD